MSVAETIARFRRASFQDKTSRKQIGRELPASRNTVRKMTRSGAAECACQRSIPPLPKIGPCKVMLDEMLTVNAGKPRSERPTRIRTFGELRVRGHDGGYDAVGRYAATRSREDEQAFAASSSFGIERSGKYFRTRAQFLIPGRHLTASIQCGRRS